MGDKEECQSANGSSKEATVLGMKCSHNLIFVVSLYT